MKNILHIGQQFPYLWIHDIYHCIGYKLLIYSYTGIHLILFFLPVIYLFILGILLTFDLFVPGDILRGGHPPLLYDTNQDNSSNYYKQYKLNFINLP